MDADQDGARTTWPAGSHTTLTLDGLLVFSGQIVSSHPGRDPRTGGVMVGYRALGLKYLANTIPVTNPNDLSGTIVYNLPSDDPNFVPSLSGLSVGQMLTFIFNGHAQALASVGITGYNATDLAALTVVPPEPVYIRGSKLFNEVEDLLSRWCAEYAAFVPASGVIRVMDTRLCPR